MTQFSPYTLVYDQIARSVAALMEKWNSGSYITKEDFLKDFNKALSDLYENAGSAKSEMQQFIKGEPPSSKKINSFINNLKEDINIAAKQLDYLAAKTVNVYNLFNAEIESEKRYAQRILSKAKVLQMYSQSNADDIVYLGDSFDNLDFVDTTKYIAGRIPLIANGTLSLQSTVKNNWNVSRVVINRSNGFLGNNHVVVKDPNSLDQKNYRYVFEESPSLGNKSNIADKNPLTYFEYEALRIRRAQSDVQSNDINNDEFCYIVNDATIVNAQQGSLINWANHNLSEPLVLDFTLEANSSQKANSIKITPYFSSSKLVKVNQIVITDKEGSEKNILAKPIYIGSSPENLTTQSFGSYFIDNAVINFDETEVIKSRIIMEQSQYQEVDILHTYWATDYTSGNKDNSPFYGSEKFNPKSLNDPSYQEIRYDTTAVVPTLTNPNIFKLNNIINKTIPVTVVRKAIGTQSSTTSNYNVPIRLEKKVIKADRMSIGIRDVSLDYNEYSQSAEIISLPYQFDLPVESLILNLELDSESLQSTSSVVSSYVSVDEGKNWLRISPIQSGYSNGDEVLAFNQNVPSGYKLPGVTYYAYPDVPKEIKNVTVKIEVSKNQTTNRTPILYSYTLGAKVKKS